MNQQNLENEGAEVTRRCQECGASVAAKATMYRLTITLAAEGGPLQFDSADLSNDHFAEIEALVATMTHLSASEATDQVHESYRFTICAACRNRIHQRLRHGPDGAASSNS